MLRLSFYLFLWIGSMGLAVFSSQNIFPITVKLGSFESIKLPLGLVLVFCAGLGAVAMTSLMGLAQKSFQFSFPNISKSTNSSTTKPFQNKPTETQKSTPKTSFTDQSKKQKQNPKDDFDNAGNDDWE